MIWALARMTRLPAHAGQLSIGLSQIGEFGFVLATVAAALGVLPSEQCAGHLAAVAASIAVLSVAVRLVRRGGAPQQEVVAGA